MLAAIETILENGYFGNISENPDLDLDFLVNMLNGATDKYPEGKSKQMSHVLLTLVIGVNRFRKKFHKTFFQVKIRYKNMFFCMLTITEICVLATYVLLYKHIMQITMYLHNGNTFQ